MTRLTSLLTTLLLILLSACVQVIEPNDTRSTQLAVSSVRDMEIRYPEGSAFALSPKYLKDVSLKPVQEQKIYQLYASAIKKNMQNKGYRFVRENNKAVFYVEFAIALTDDLGDESISQKFGVSPGLQEKGDFEKGSFLIAIEDAAMKQRIWRGAIQGFVQDNYSASERLERADVIVEMVLSQFFK